MSDVAPPGTAKPVVVMGWAAVAISALLGTFVGMFAGGEAVSFGWGAFLAHFAQVVAIVITALAAVRWPRVGGTIVILAGLGTAVLFQFDVAVAFLYMPLIIAGLLYFFGRPTPRTPAYALIIMMPLAAIVITALMGVLLGAGQ